MKSIICKNESELLTHLANDKQEEYRLLWVFMREVDTKNDELFVITQKDAEKKIYSYIHSNQKPLPNIWDIYYDAFMYQNEIYDFYGKPTKETENHILRLHTYPDNYFSKRKLGKAMIANKKSYIFTKMEGEWLTEVQVGPIHAGIISPWHFRFTVDGEDILNLDNQMGRKHRGVESYFMTEKNHEKQLEAVQEIVWDSVVAYTITFARMLEESSNIQISDEVKLTRILLLELERIYNHLRTMWALGNDIGQAFILNGYLAIREQFMEINNILFGSRTLKKTVTLWWVSKLLSKHEQKLLTDLLKKVKNRVQNLIDLAIKGTGNYDRFKDTGIITAQTAAVHWALWVAARASTLVVDERIYDVYYTDLNISFKISLGEQGDSLDRFVVRAKEYMTSMDIIIACLHKLVHGLHSESKLSAKIILKDGIYLGTTEGHRGQILQMIVIEKGEIVYFKSRDPSFVNRNLIDYAVLKNIIADFPICNKSLDLSYSGFDI